MTKFPQSLTSTGPCTGCQTGQDLDFDFAFAFQPIVEVGTGAVFGYESLLRGHDRIGYDSPLDLIDHAAEAGQLLALEQMVATRAVAKFSALPEHGGSTLFLNLDVRLIREGNALIDTLLDQLRKAQR